MNFKRANSIDLCKCRTGGIKFLIPVIVLLVCAAFLAATFFTNGFALSSSNDEEKVINSSNEQVATTEETQVENNASLETEACDNNLVGSSLSTYAEANTNDVTFTVRTAFPDSILTTIGSKVSFCLYESGVGTPYKTLSLSDTSATYEGMKVFSGNITLTDEEKTKCVITNLICHNDSWSSSFGMTTTDCFPADNNKIGISDKQYLENWGTYSWKEYTPPVQHTVKFDSKGGTGTMADQTFTEGVEQELSENSFTKEGYTFLGWSEDSTATTATYADKEKITVSKDMTLYAVWNINKYTITLQAGEGGSVDPASVTNVQYGKVVTDAGNTLKIDGAVVATATPTAGYKFKNWTGIPIDGKIVGDVTITANFEEDAPVATYTATIKTDGNGTVDKESLTGIASGTSVSSTDNILTIGSTNITATPKTGYEFKEWVGIPSEGKITSDVTITANFKEVIVVDVPEGVHVDPVVMNKVLENAREWTCDEQAKIDFSVKPSESTESGDIALIKEHTGDAKLSPYAVTLKAIYTDTEGKEVVKDYGDANTVVIPVTYDFDFINIANIATHRVHNDIYSEISETPNTEGEYVEYNKDAGSLTINAMKYSTYAVSYKTADSSVTPTTSCTSSTGDSIPFAGLVGLFVASAGAVVFALRKRTQF